MGWRGAGGEAGMETTREDLRLIVYHGRNGDGRREDVAEGQSKRPQQQQYRQPDHDSIILK